MADLTGQPYLAPDRQSEDTAAALPGISAALHDTTLDDVPDMPVRPLPELVRAGALCADVLNEISALPGPTPENTTIAEARGILHLTSALVAARDGHTADVTTHLTEARSLAAHTGERNHLRYHFGPTNVAGWELSIALENGDGPEAAERFAAAPVTLSVLGSKCREGYVRFALARCWAQAGGTRDGEALRALDAADRLAPVVVRNDPLARELVVTLDHRARHRVWELDSLRNRFGIGGHGSRSANN